MGRGIERHVSLHVLPGKVDEFENFFESDYRPAMAQMTGFIKAIWELALSMLGQTPDKRATRKARKEVKRDKKAGGMDAVRGDSSAWFRRKRR